MRMPLSSFWNSFSFSVQPALKTWNSSGASTETNLPTGDLQSLQYLNIWIRSKNTCIQVHSLHFHLSDSGSWMPSLPLELMLLWDSSRRNSWLMTWLLLKQLRLWLHLFKWWQQTLRPSRWLRWVYCKVNYSVGNKNGHMKHLWLLLSSRPWQSTTK